MTSLRPFHLAEWLILIWDVILPIIATIGYIVWVIRRKGDHG